MLKIIGSGIVETVTVTQSRKVSRREDVVAEWSAANMGLMDINFVCMCGRSTAM